MGHKISKTHRQNQNDYIHDQRVNTEKLMQIENAKQACKTLFLCYGTFGKKMPKPLRQMISNSVIDMAKNDHETPMRKVINREITELFKDDENSFNSFNC